MFIVVSGLPGTGKTAVARGVSERLGATHLSIDLVEDALLGAGLAPGWTTGVAAYEAVRSVAENNLTLGRSVVVDAVNDSEAARDTWRRASASTGVPVNFVLLTLSDVGEHRRRLEGRQRGLSHVPEPTWEQVQARAGSFEPWVDVHAAIDATVPLGDLVQEVLGLVRA
jgi:predicted kinase